jgi:lipopolysaccharide/colanic/teichoic acid biosynthesis glycosyltransferase
MTGAPTTGYDRVKRLMDLAVTVPALVLSLPVQAVTAAAIRLTMGRPVLFRQQRPGLHGEPFELVKFRTMSDPTDTVTLHSTTRVTRLGAVLRATSLDELPSLWNVVRGDMSLVGPRPLLMAYLDRYTPEQARRHEVRPGVTGLAQISGRNAVTWDARLALDVQYVERRSLRLDLSILVGTVSTVLRRSGVDAGSGVTMSEFRGQERP